MPTAGPVDWWWVAVRVCDVVDPSCENTQAQFLERGLPVESLRRHSGERVGEIWAPEEVTPWMFLWQPHDKKHLLLPHWPPGSRK